MEGSPAQSSSPVAEAAPQPAAPTPESTDGQRSGPGPLRAASFEDVFAEMYPDIPSGPSAVSNGNGPDQDETPTPAVTEESSAPKVATDAAESKPDTAPAPGDAPSPDEDEEPTPAESQTEEQQKLSRRGAAARIAELEEKVAAFDPEAIAKAARQQWEDEQAQKAAAAADESERAQILADQRRYEELRDRPSASLSQEEWDFLEAQRELREKYPQVQKHFNTVLETRVAELQAENERTLAAHKKTLDDAHAATTRNWAEALVKSAQLPGVDGAKLHAASTFDAREAYIHEASATWKEAEVRAELQPRIDELEAEVRELRDVGPRGLGSGRAVLSGGRSTNGESRPVFDEARPSRENLAAALGFAD